MRRHAWFSPCSHPRTGFSCWWGQRSTVWCHSCGWWWALSQSCWRTESGWQCLYQRGFHKGPFLLRPIQKWVQTNALTYIPNDKGVVVLTTKRSKVLLIMREWKALDEDLVELKALDHLKGVEVPDNDVSLLWGIKTQPVKGLSISMHLYLITLFKNKKIGRSPEQALFSCVELISLNLLGSPYESSGLRRCIYQCWRQWSQRCRCHDPISLKVKNHFSQVSLDMNLCR